MSIYWEPCRIGSDVSEEKANAIISAFSGVNEWIAEENARIAKAEIKGDIRRKQFIEEQIKEEKEIEKKRAETGLAEFIPDLLLSDCDYREPREMRYLIFKIQGALIKFKNQLRMIAKLKLNKYYRRCQDYLKWHHQQIEIFEEFDYSTNEEVTKMKIDTVFHFCWERGFVDVPPSEEIPYVEICSSLEILKGKRN